MTSSFFFCYSLMECPILFRLVFSCWSRALRADWMRTWISFLCLFPIPPVLRSGLSRKLFLCTSLTRLIWSKTQRWLCIEKFRQLFVDCIFFHFRQLWSKKCFLQLIHLLFFSVFFSIVHVTTLKGRELPGTGLSMELSAVGWSLIGSRWLFIISPMNDTSVVSESDPSMST